MSKFVMLDDLEKSSKSEREKSMALVNRLITFFQVKYFPVKDDLKKDLFELLKMLLDQYAAEETDINGYCYSILAAALYERFPSDFQELIK